MNNQHRKNTDHYLLIYKPNHLPVSVNFKLLEKSGIEVVFAVDMKSMIDIMRKNEASAVLAFYESKEKNAIDFLRYIMRQHQHTQRIYIIDQLNKTIMEKAVNKAHINYLLISPFEEETLVELVTKAFKRYQALTQPSRRYHDLAGITADLLINVSKFQREASTDGLTKLYNRRSFDKIINEALMLFREKQLPFSLIMLDLDDFKKLNDTFGHSAGDMVLKEFGRVLNKNMRREDSSFRYGGEEFAIIASGDQSENILCFVNRIRDEIKETTVRYKTHRIQFTFSAGIASMQNTFSREDLINAADQALYQAKKEGKDRIIIYHPS